LIPLKVLSNDYFVVFQDQCGTGLSPGVASSELALDSSLTDLDSIVDYFSKWRKVNSIGHSWGAMLVSAYLGRHPSKVDHAVLVEPGSQYNLSHQRRVFKGGRWF
jgi:proline iminopeptidase